MKSVIPVLGLIIASVFSVTTAAEAGNREQAIEHLKAAVAISETVEPPKSTSPTDIESEAPVDQEPPPNPLQEALEHLEQASKYASAALDETGHPGIEEALLHLNVAVEHARLRHPAETIEHAREAIKLLEAAR